MSRKTMKKNGAGPGASGRTARRSAAVTMADIDLVNSVPSLMRYVHRGLSRGMEHRLAKYRITIGTWYFLRVLWEKDGLSQTELSERIGIVGPTTVIAIGRMVRDGLAVQRPDPGDRRKTRIFLTPKGKRLKARLLNEAVEFVADALRSIPEPEIRQLRVILRKISRNLEPHMPPTLFSMITADLRD
jgi:DNA-binding MarR family transcriptional regulator